VQPHFAFNDRVIAVSEATARFHRRWNLVRTSRLDVVPNFVDVDRFDRVPPGTRERLRGAWGIGPHDVALGAVGSLIAEKGLDHLVAALRTVRAAVPHARLVLAGDGPFAYTARLRAQAARLEVDEAIFWLGHREDIPEILSALDVFVLASLDEALPMAVLEAMAAGLPVVAAAVGGVPEIVGQEDTGLLVPPRDAPALASALIALARDPGRRHRLGTAGRQRALERFSAATQVPLVEAALQRAAGTSRWLR
jgi:glycosyltransferase involved in cell wall biosynthesis